MRQTLIPRLSYRISIDGGSSVIKIVIKFSFSLSNSEEHGMWRRSIRFRWLCVQWRMRLKLFLITLWSLQISWSLVEITRMIHSGSFHESFDCFATEYGEQVILLMHRFCIWRFRTSVPLSSFGSSKPFLDFEETPINSFLDLDFRGWLQGLFVLRLCEISFVSI